LLTLDAFINYKQLLPPKTDQLDKGLKIVHNADNIQIRSKTKHKRNRTHTNGFGLSSLDSQAIKNQRVLATGYIQKRSSTHLPFDEGQIRNLTLVGAQFKLGQQKPKNLDIVQ
jgi:hypothetical protein